MKLLLCLAFLGMQNDLADNPEPSPKPYVDAPAAEDPPDREVGGPRTKAARREAVADMFPSLAMRIPDQVSPPPAAAPKSDGPGCADCAADRAAMRAELDAVKAQLASCQAQLAQCARPVAQTAAPAPVVYTYPAPVYRQPTYTYYTAPVASYAQTYSAGGCDPATGTCWNSAGQITQGVNPFRTSRGLFGTGLFARRR